MKIALIGYGKMGRMIEKIAEARGHSITARLTSGQWHPNDLQDADICIDFTHSGCVLENLEKAAASGKGMIIGTTGWEERMESARTIVEKSSIGALYSPNFSIGIHLMLQILGYASALMNAFKEYDAAGIESHHKEKKDKPSGTALAIARIIKENTKHMENVPFSSIRCGSIPGIHTVLFDSPEDTITITHEARNREGFAKGAVQAAEWLKEKKGFYTFADCIKDLVSNCINKPSYF